ncbi:MAG: penicillin-binding protein activator [Desulfobacterota bacterium]|jgi:ABC-type branched-subunit amino acid transport system substrate-binding protein|nr:penicillin-binding protein activator [Thermodesulfobacteriota bacterium]
MMNKTAFALSAACLAVMLCTAATVIVMPGPAHAADGAVGVLIPLSGKWESVGQKILRGIMTAGEVFGQGPGSNVQFVVRDYGNDEESIPSIIDELDRRHSVVGIIGPVGERASEIACREAQKRGLPAIMFTQAETPPLDGTYCFRNFLTIDMQARALLDAARSMGITRFGVMSPDDHFGRTFSEKFQRLAPSYGIQVVKARVYPLQKTDYRQELTALFSGLKKSPAKGQPGDMEALLVPDSAQNAAVIASYLSYLKIRNVRLFGPTLWDSPEFLKVGGRYVEDAVFLSGFFQGSIMSAPQDFSRLFQDTFHAQPSVWEASAYDAARMMQGFLREHRPSRADLRAYLAGLRRFGGASGITSFSPDGTLEKSIHLLSVRSGVVYEIRP